MMITLSNFKELLVKLGYKKRGDKYEKKFSSFGKSMRVDFSKKKLFYPDDIKGADRNDGFNAPENFVVFECVNRLLEKGYRPEHIELEKEWHLYCLFNGKIIDLERVGSKAFGKSLNSAYLRDEVLIPIPPISVQQQVINECSKIDEEYNSTRMSIETYRQKIEALFAELDIANTRGGVQTKSL